MKSALMSPDVWFRISSRFRSFVVLLMPTKLSKPMGKEWWNWFDGAIVLMWLVEVALQSVIRLEPAVLRSLSARRQCAGIILQTAVDLQCALLRHDAHGSTTTAHPASQDDTRL